MTATVSAPASASVITSPVGTYHAFPVENVFGPGPQVFAGITFSSTNASIQGGAVFGYDLGYGFGDDGISYQTLSALNDSSGGYDVVDSVTFSFSTPAFGVGAVLNWYAGLDTYAQGPVTIAVYNKAATLIESYTVQSGGVNIATPDSFYGFHEGSKDISSFVLTDGFIGAVNGLTVDLPEPGSWTMMLAGFAAIGLALRRRRRRPQASPRMV